jgi:hypothetical protein
VAYGASVWPREGATGTHWPGERAEARARQGLPGGGRESSNSGELAAWPEQHAHGRATRDPSGVRSSTHLRRKAAGGGVHREGSYGGRRRLVAHTRGEGGGAFMVGSRRLR